MFKGTTVVCVRRDSRVAMAGDGQVTLGSQIVKTRARKVRPLKWNVLAGFAGSTADAMTLFERFERSLDANKGDLLKASVELVKEWRTDRALRRLEAMMLVADLDRTLLLSGSGDVLEMEEQCASIGSGSGYALAAARAFLEGTDWDAGSIAKRSLEIASEICIYTNSHVTLEEIAR